MAKVGGVALPLCSLMLADATRAPAQPASPPVAPGTAGTVVARLAGHWSCTGMHGEQTERSYAIPPRSSKEPSTPLLEEFGREDGTERASPGMYIFSAVYEP